MVANEKILFARRRLEEVANLDMVGDLKWDEATRVWYILVKTHVDNPINISIAEDTMWYIVLQDKYPEGEVKIYPAIDGGIEDTFYHQSNNGLLCSNRLWRKGKLCLNDPYDEIKGIRNEPNNYEDKLYWNAKRAVEWVSAASRNQLVKNGDFYEIPEFRIRKGHHIIYNEDMVSMMEWEDSQEYYGYVDFWCEGNNQYYVDNYVNTSGMLCKATKWGKYISECKEKIHGAWIFLKEEPVIKGWQAPNNFKELKQAFKHQGFAFREILEKIIPRFRDGKRHILMIGFPVPKKIGEDVCIIHWEAILLPVLSYGKKYSKGFRNNELGWKMRDFQEIITDDTDLDWLLSENWNSDEILNRGCFDRVMTRSKFLLIGAGTLGASIGEQLVRGGVYNLTIMDDDIYSIGNSARHTLSVDSVDKYKANELAKRFNSINPNINVKFISSALTEENIEVINEYDIILDCTANNEVLYLLSSYETKRKKKYISISFGYKAEVLYLAYQKGCKFALERYIANFSTKLKENELAILDKELPWEGIGCWSPVFPAMAADVQLVASFSTIIIKKILEQDLYDEKYFIYERVNDEDGVIKGFVRV